MAAEDAEAHVSYIIITLRQVPTLSVTVFLAVFTNGIDILVKIGGAVACRTCVYESGRLHNAPSISYFWHAIRVDRL